MAEINKLILPNGESYDIADSSARANVATLQGDMTTAKGNITTLQGNVGTLQTDLGTAQGNITSLQGDVSTLKTDMSTAQGNITSLQGDMTTAKGNITTLQGDMTTAKSDISGLKTTTGNLDTRITNVIGNAAEEHNTLGKISADLKTVQDLVGSGEGGAFTELTERTGALETAIANVYTKSEVYTKTETDGVVASKVSEIVAGAPEDFNTLKEMSDWISTHSGSASEMNSAIQDLQANKMDADAIQVVSQSDYDALSAEQKAGNFYFIKA
jgi:chromosome segregation ATPase